MDEKVDVKEAEEAVRKLAHFVDNNGFSSQKHKESAVIPDVVESKRRWRQPTMREMEELQLWFEREQGLNQDESAHALSSSNIIVLENYVSDSPGYCGRIMFSVGGYPEAFLVHQWGSLDGELKEISGQK